MKQTLIGKTLQELTDLAATLKQPSFRARQLAEWLYQHHATDIKDMTNLPAKLREHLADSFVVGVARPIECAESQDGTKKYLFATGDKHYIETAMIPADDQRKTLCVSTQVGCKRACSFCATGQQGFHAQLSAGQILNQYLSCNERDEITNLVYMGMGEPFDNYQQVARSIEILTAKYGMAKSPSRITVSTVGIVPAMREYLTTFNAHLAISLHSPYHHERAAMMPVENQYPIEKVIRELRNHDFSGQRRLTFEYAMIAGSNDSLQHARDTIQLLKGLDCRINLIPCNPTHDPTINTSHRGTIEAFQNQLKRADIVTTIRKSKGTDIQAACGMLSTQRMSA